MLFSYCKFLYANATSVILTCFFYGCRPRLGSALPKILACGLLFFVLASIEGCFRAFSVSIQTCMPHLLQSVHHVKSNSIAVLWHSAIIS